MGMGHVAPRSAPGGRRPAALLARMAGDWRVPDVGINTPRGPLGTSRRGFRCESSQMGVSTCKVKGAEPLDAPGGTQISRHGRDGLVRCFGDSILQWDISGSKAGSKGISTGCEHEASKRWLGTAEAVASHGGTQRIPSTCHPRRVDCVLGSGRGILSLDVTPRDNQVFRRRGTAGPLCEVPGLYVRVGAVDVLRKQAVCDIQAPYASGVRDRGLVSCRRLCSSVPVTEGGNQGSRQASGPNDEAVRDVPRNRKGSVEPAISGDYDLWVGGKHGRSLQSWTGDDPTKQGGESPNGAGRNAGSGGKLLTRQVLSEGRGKADFGTCSVRSGEAVVGGILLGIGHAKQILVGSKRANHAGDGRVSKVPAGSAELVQRNANLAAARFDSIPLGCIRKRGLGCCSLVTSREFGAYCTSRRILGERDANSPCERQRGAGLLTGNASPSPVPAGADGASAGRQSHSERGSPRVPRVDVASFPHGCRKENMAPFYRNGGLAASSRICKHKGQRRGRPGESRARPRRLGDYRQCLGVDRKQLRPSRLGSVRFHGKSTMHTVHGKALPAGVSLATSAISALGGPKQLLLPSRVTNIEGATVTACLQGGGHCGDTNVSGPMVAASTGALGSSVRPTACPNGVSPRPIRTSRAVAVTGVSAASPICRVQSKGPGPVVETSWKAGEYEIARIVDERGDKFLLEWVNYATPSWEEKSALYDKKGRCLCPVVLAEWKSFQSLLEGRAGGPLPIRVRVSPSERHEVTAEQMAAHSAFMASKARSADTARNYHRLWREVVGPFCRLFKYDPWALSGMQIANLLVWREMTGKAHEVERLLNAVRVVYAEKNLTMPDSPLAREVVKGSRRMHAEEKKDIDRVEFPVAEFARYCASNEGRLRTRVRDKCLLAIGLRCMRRPSELAAFKRRHVCWVAPSLAGWSSAHNAPKGFENKWLRVYVRCQKNDQEANGQFILIEPTWSASCPCRLLVEYLQEFGFTIGPSIQGDKPLFVSLNDNVSPISSGAVNSAVKRVAKVLGLGLNITGHSLRIGGCTAAAAAGIPMEIIRVIGGWFSDAMLSYIRASAAPALSVTRRMGL